VQVEGLVWAPVPGAGVLEGPTAATAAASSWSRDRVFVRQMSGFVTPRTIHVQGEVLYAGPCPT